jgi:glycosyltransferase involved in cell wall biosynthesis
MILTSTTADRRPEARDGASTKVLVVGQTPPPFHGQAFMIEKLLRSELADVQLIHVRMNFSSHVNAVGRFRLSKVFHLFGLIARIIYHRFAQGARILYYPPASSFRVPMYRDFVILICTRWLFDKTIFHFHAAGISDMYEQLPSWQRWLFRRAYFGADAAVRLSEFNPEDGRRMCAKREYVIPYGIDDPLMNRAEPPPNPAATEDDRLRMLFVGTVCESKGVMVLIEACGELAARGVPFDLEIMGQWESEEFAGHAQRRIEQLKLSKRIRFLGALLGEDKFATFRRANVFCFPTHHQCEALPVVLLEATACRLPVVSTRWRGIPSIVDDGRAGFLVEPHDPVAVADRLERLSRESELRAQMGLAGREGFLQKFTSARNRDRMRDMFLDVAGVSPVKEHLPVAEASAAQA